MKKYLSFTLLLFVFITISCKEKINNDQNDYQFKLIENQYNIINKRLDYLYNIDTSLFSKRKQELSEIRSDFAFLREKISSSINDKEIHNIRINLIQIGVKEEDLLSYLSLLKMDELEQDEKLLNLNFLELLFLEYYNSFYSNMFYNAFRIEPIVVAQKNSIKLGEEYRCDIYIAGYNGFNTIAKVDNKVLENDQEIPFFTIKPETKGKKEFKGELGLKWDIMRNDTIYLPFTINFTVE